MAKVRDCGSSATRCSHWAAFATELVDSVMRDLADSDARMGGTPPRRSRSCGVPERAMTVAAVSAAWRTRRFSTGSHDVGRLEYVSWHSRLVIVITLAR
jgi:hypothetical protein